MFDAQPRDVLDALTRAVVDAQTRAVLEAQTRAVRGAILFIISNDTEVAETFNNFFKESVESLGLVENNVLLNSTYISFRI